MASRKESQLTTITDFVSGDLVTGLRSATNVNFSYTALFNAMSGLTNMNQVGNQFGAPVLDQPQAGVNNFRNLENGLGVSFSISAENGIIGKWNVLQDKVGFPITSGLTSKVPVLSSIIAGTGVSIAQGTNALTISASGIPTATNTIIINQESDFPIQDATTITLSSQVRYVIGAAISSAKRFICEDGFVFTAENILGVTYTYTGTGDMFTSVLAGGTVEDISLDAPNANQGFNMSDTGLTKLFFCRNVRFNNVPKWGTYTGFVTTIITFSSSRNSDDGLTIAGTGQLITNISAFAILSTSATCVQLDFGAAVISNIELDNLILVAPAGGIQLKGAANSANVTVGSLGMMSNSAIQGGATQQLSGITNSDIRWDFTGNNVTNDSISDALIHTSSNALVTTITSVGVGVKVNAVFVDDDISRFTSDGTGKLTYIGEKAARLPIDVTGTLLATGGDKQVDLCVAINGTVVVATCVQGTASGTKAAALTCIWQHDFQPNDFVEAYVSNQSTTDDLTVTQAVLRIN